MLLTPKDIGLLFHCRTQTHIWHLQTRSYSEHKALGDFYSQWLDLVDALIETDSASERPKTPDTAPPFSPYAAHLPEKFLTTSVLPMLERLSTSSSDEVGIQNILADMINLTNHTIYLLQFS